MNEENEIMLNRVITTLNLIEVKGKDNLDRMLGCIQALERVINSMKSPVKTEEKGE